LNEAYIHGHWVETIEFMKTFMNAGFKNNPYLHKGIMTGIFRVAKESIFSDMNNLNVSTILSDSYSEYFGFTEEEVKDILKYYKIEESTQSVAYWYNGYLFGRKKRKVIIMIAKTIFVICLLLIVIDLPLEIVMYRFSFKKRLIVVISLLIVLVVSAYLGFN